MGGLARQLLRGRTPKSNVCGPSADPIRYRVGARPELTALAVAHGEDRPVRPLGVEAVVEVRRDAGVGRLRVEPDGPSVEFTFRVAEAAQ